MKKLQFLANLMAFSGALWVSFCTFAQETVNDRESVPVVTKPTALKPIMITTDPLSVSGDQIEMSRPVSILRQERMQTRDLRNIGEVVSQELGISASDFGPAVGRPVIRGLSGARVQVLEDGISTMDVSTISPDHAVAAEALFADQVEIFRGSSALLYGSGTSGGVVNIVNHRILEQVPDEANGGLYSHYSSVADDFTGAFRLNTGAGRFAWHLDGMKRHSGDYSIPGYAELKPKSGAKKGILENSDIQTTNFSSGLSYIGDRGFLGVAASRFVNNYGVFGHSHHDHDEEGKGTRIRQKQTRLDIKGAINSPLPGLQKIKTRWGHNNHIHEESEDGIVETLLINREWNGRVEMLHQPWAGWKGVLGFQYQNRALTAVERESFVPSAQLDSLGIFLLERRDVGQWNFEMSGRFDHQQTKRKEDGFEVNHNAFSISGGVVRKFADGYAVGADISRVERAPTLEELFSNGAHLSTGTFERGNSFLTREKSSNFDLFLRKQGGGLDWTLNLFAKLINDFIFQQELDLTGDGLPDRVDMQGRLDEDGYLLLKYRQNNANFLGVEFETIAHLLNDHRGKLDLRLWTDYVRGKLSVGGYLPRMTPLRFGGSLDYVRGPWRGRVDVMQVHKQTDIASLETNTAGYTMLNAQLDYQFDWREMNYSLFIRGSNLLNEEARRHTSFLKDRVPLPGRSGLVGVRVDF